MEHPGNSRNDSSPAQNTDLSVLEMIERPEGAKESTSNSDTSNTRLFDQSTLSDNSVSHNLFLSPDKSYKISIGMYLNFLLHI